MSEKTKLTRPESPVVPVHTQESHAESPTTAHQLEFDDEQDVTTTPPRSEVLSLSSAVKPDVPPKDETAPAKPPRPLNPRDQAEKMLQEAFPTIERTVIKAVLSASGGQVEPAFNALLEMTDPEAVQQEQPPAMPPRPPRKPTTTNQSQLEADEMYARQLAEHYNALPALPTRPQPEQRQQRPDRYNSDLQGSRAGRPGANPNPDDYHWRSFIDDDLPEIRDNIRQGFLETQKTVTGWLTSFKKKLDGEEEEEDEHYSKTTAQNTSANRAPTQTQPLNRRSQEYQVRRSADYNRYDADPQVIGDDFSKLDMRDGDHPPRTTSRPAANPNLFRDSGEQRRMSPASGRKVSFQEGPPEEIQDMYSSPLATKPSGGPNVGTPSSGKGGKWQPLSTVAPSPIAENDPFSLGDSDDEKDAKPITLTEGDEITKTSIGGEKETSRENGKDNKSDSSSKTAPVADTK